MAHRCLYLVVLAFALDVLPAGADPPETILVSVNADATHGGNLDSIAQGMTPDGRFVLFDSSATDLAPNDINGYQDVFVRDLVSGTTTLVSVNRAGSGTGDSESAGIAISANGRFVLFESFAIDLVDVRSKRRLNVFVRDLKAGTTSLVSVNRAGTAAARGLSGGLALSPSGRFAVFISNSTNLTRNDKDDLFDLFVRDTKAQKTALVSVELTDKPSERLRSIPDQDGRFVLFNGAGHYTPYGTPGGGGIYVRDLRTATTTLVTLDREGTAGANGYSDAVAMTPNGRFVLFDSQASDLVKNDSGFGFDAFVRDVTKETATLVSVNRTGTGPANGESNARGISSGGRFVVFGSRATDLVDNDSNESPDVYVRDMATSITSLVSVNLSGTSSGVLALPQAISSNGRFVLFGSWANDLVPVDGNTNFDVFVRDLRSQTTTLVTMNRMGAGGANHSSGPVAISRNGRFVLFNSYATDLIATDTTPAQNVFVRRMW
ncbi:MAG TPA: hypothetical protein VFA43_22230 [Gemmatimonadaceae bacterium]|nr:hypothetical protein [Gemmatimonadaceae bacterium]